jgi:hypothetical protein
MQHGCRQASSTCPVQVVGRSSALCKLCLAPYCSTQSLCVGCLQITAWKNSSIASNPEQAAAVRCIVSGTSGLLPFIIWGPPGTGKTSTLVEAATQVGINRSPDSLLVLLYTTSYFQLAVCCFGGVVGALLAAVGVLGRVCRDW